MSGREKFTIVGRRPRYTAAQIRRMVASMARRIDFPRVRSYGDGGAPGERIEITKDVEIDLTGSDILVPLPDCRKHSDGGRR